MKVYTTVDKGVRHVVEHNGGTGLRVSLQVRRRFLWNTVAVEQVSVLHNGGVLPLGVIDQLVEGAMERNLRRSNKVLYAQAYVADRSFNATLDTL